ncbi:MAG: carboxypeptidase-like regulatory domain-containing protein [Prolixibacteraceae bacterium]|jgi:hypothetical protein|nr:carboxypeptidase-like regulatory domain-containing protein [Prolixibacteraceae bacterium]
MKKALLTFFVVSVFASAFATVSDKSENKGKTTELSGSSAIPSVSITGKVIDLNSGEALAGVQVAIEGSIKKVHTDFDGNFKIENLQPGSYNVIASYISYNKSFVEKLEVGKSNQPLNIKLQSAN